MRCLVDTCGWIEWLTEGVLLSKFTPWFDDLELVYVPTCVQFELYKWVKRERDERLALEVVALTEQANVISLDTSTALLAADLALTHKLSFADAVIYASAQKYEVELVTSDDHFEGLSGVTFYSKKRHSQ